MTSLEHPELKLGDVAPDEQLLVLTKCQLKQLVRADHNLSCTVRDRLSFSTDFSPFCACNLVWVDTVTLTMLSILG